MHGHPPAHPHSRHVHSRHSIRRSTLRTAARRRRVSRVGLCRRVLRRKKRKKHNCDEKPHKEPFCLSSHGRRNSNAGKKLANSQRDIPDCGGKTSDAKTEQRLPRRALQRYIQFNYAKTRNLRRIKGRRLQRRGYPLRPSHLRSGRRRSPQASATEAITTARTANGRGIARQGCGMTVFTSRNGPVPRSPAVTRRVPH